MVVVLAGMLLLSGCKTQAMLTADATGCGITQLDIVDSRWKREGSTTRWCAKCKAKLYQCVSNPERSRVECAEAQPGSACE